MKILIVDDHAIVRKGMRQIIAEEYPLATVGEAADTDGMIAQVIKADWDIIICDINMPGRNGIEGLIQVKEMKPEIPVLIMSVNSEEQYAVRMFKLGAAGYLSKDTIHEDLLKAIDTVYSGKVFITPTVAEKLINTLNSDIEKKPHEYLSNREFAVMKQLAGGSSVSEIAAQLFISATTVSTYKARIFEKLKMKTNADLTRYAIENKII
jgi:two-component system, NarL family, invasion response regulator UvrY